MAPPAGRGSDEDDGRVLEAFGGAAGGGAAEEEGAGGGGVAAADAGVPLGQAEEEGAPSGSREEVEGPDGRLGEAWTGCPLSSASSERGSVKEDGGSASGQEKLESSLSLTSTA